MTLRGLCSCSPQTSEGLCFVNSLQGPSCSAFRILLPYCDGAITLTTNASCSMEWAESGGHKPFLANLEIHQRQGNPASRSIGPMGPAIQRASPIMHACMRACAPVCVCGYNKEHKEHSKRNLHEVKATNQKRDDQQPHNQEQVQKARGAKSRQDHIIITNIHKTRH
jgi:hypothetical protein